jgi:hypothetical protein
MKEILAEKFWYKKIIILKEGLGPGNENKFCIYL